MGAVAAKGPSDALARDPRILATYLGLRDARSGQHHVST
jgi:hypothetical protein